MFPSKVSQFNFEIFTFWTHWGVFCGIRFVLLFHDLNPCGIKSSKIHFRGFWDIFLKFDKLTQTNYFHSTSEWCCSGNYDQNEVNTRIKQGNIDLNVVFILVSLVCFVPLRNKLGNVRFSFTLPDLTISKIQAGSGRIYGKIPGSDFTVK